VAADGLAVGAGDLAGAVGVDGQVPAELVQDDVVVPPAVVLEVGQAGVAAVGAVGDVVGFTAGGGLVAAAGELARLVPQRDQAPQVQGDVVGLALVRILYLCVQWARTPSRLACSDSSGLARRIQLVISRSLGGAGAAGGAQARALQGLRYAQTVA
jgi:hypothetical protein